MSLWKKKSEQSAAPAKRKEGPVPWDIHHGTFAQRDAFMAERKQRAAERDSERLHAQAHPTTVRIARDDGYATVAPGTLTGADEVVAAANAVIDGIGHDAILERKVKGGYMATGLLTNADLTLDSPYMRFALSDEVLRAVSDYLGLVPLLMKIDIWYSFAGRRDEPRASQLWHLDHDDTTQMKLFVNVNDVTPEMGPLTVADAATSERFPFPDGFDFGKGNRVPDDEVRSVIRDDQLVSFSGPRGTVAFVDTSRCLHFGSRVEEGADPRRMVMVQFLTPYSFEFGDDPYASAPFRGLSEQASGTLQRLALGHA
ncbi:MAG TPA: hypothetical protein VFW85_04175 [Gaiellaceae bacterium]|nr:hypothetical protein [Gaiellaceae bacterium]